MSEPGNKNEAAETGLGCLMLIAIAFVPFWYWWNYDGIRSVSNVVAEEIFHKGFSAGGVSMASIIKTTIDKAVTDKKYKDEYGGITFEDALEKTKPQKIEWKSSPVLSNKEIITKALGGRDDEGGLLSFLFGRTRSIIAIAEYNPEKNNDISHVLYNFHTKKDYFFNFSPTVLYPTEVAYVHKDGRSEVYSAAGGEREQLKVLEELFKVYGLRPQ